MALTPERMAQLDQMMASRMPVSRAPTGIIPPRSHRPAGRTKGKGGTLTSLISELGGAGGAWGGAAAGGAIGAGFGGVGAVPGALIGAILGGFSGGTVGRGVENKIRDNQDFFGKGGSARSALTEGAWSGALSGAGTAFQAARGAKALATGAKGASSAIGGVDDVTKAAKLSAGKNSLVRRGNSWYRSTLGIDDIVMPNKTKPGTIFKADQLAAEARKIGLKGPPKAMERQVAKQQEFLGKQVDNILSKSKGTTSASNLLGRAKKEVMDKLPIQVEGVPVRQELVRSLNQLGKGKVNATTIKQWQKGLNVDAAFKKLEFGGSLTAKETADVALWRQADDWITKLAPAAKQATVRQHKLYGLSQGLARMTRTPGDPSGMVALGARIASPGIRAIENAAGRGLMKVGGAAPGGVPGGGAFAGARSTLGGMAPRTSQAASALRRQATYQAPGNLLSAITEPETPDIEPMNDQFVPGYDSSLSGNNEANLMENAGFDPAQYEQPTSDPMAEQQGPTSLEDVLMQAQQLAGPNASESEILSYAKWVMSTQADAAKASGSGLNITKITGQQYQLAKRGEQSLQQLAQLLQTDPGALQRTATPGRKLPIIGGFISNAAGTGDIDAIGYNIAASLLRLETGAAANEGEIRNLQSQIMPRAGDSAQTIQTKLSQLQTAFGGILSTAGDTDTQDPYQETEQYQQQYGGQY